MNTRISFERQLSLKELIVVLLVLIALAGIIIPKFSNTQTQTHVAATSTKAPAIESSLRSRISLRSGDIGNRFDSLVVGPAGAPVVATYMPGNTFWEALSLNASDIAALAGIGVTELVAANAPEMLTNNDATSGSHDTAPVTPSSVIAMRTADGEDVSMLRSFNMTPELGARYIAFGIGDQCTLVGGPRSALFSGAPLHFGNTTQTRSKLAYARYFLVVEIANIGTANAKARFLGAAAPHESGLERKQGHLEGGYSD